MMRSQIRRCVALASSLTLMVVAIVARAAGDKKGAPKASPTSCAYQSTAPLRHLYQDASRQVLGLTAAEDCLGQLRASGKVELITGEHRIDATVRVAGAGSVPVELDVQRLPAGIAAQRHVFDIVPRGGGDSIGTTSLDVRARGIAVDQNALGHPRLAISFGRQEKLDRLHSGESADGNAVTSFSELSDDDKRTPLNERNAGNRQRESEELYVHNTLQLTVDRDLTDAARAITQARQSHGASAQTDVPHFAWQLRSTSVPAAWLSYEASGEPWWDTSAGLDRLSQLTFSVFDATPRPLTVDVDLVDINGVEPRVLFSTTIQVASSARSESLPLQVQDLLYVLCGDDTDAVMDPSWGASYTEGLDIIMHGQLRAVEDADVATGQCKLVFDAERLMLLTGYRKKKHKRGQVVRFFGEQDIHVSVSREGEVAEERVWSVDPMRREELRLASLEKLASKTGSYTVRATLNGLVPPQVVYRPRGSGPSTPVKADRALGAFEFVAGLLPRGKQGWVALPIRTFITIPVDVFGYRLPADPSELETSSDSPHIQGVSLKAGIALVVEPWNYDTGSNPWPIPLRLLSGFHLFDLTREGAAPSFITGVSAAFPLLELPKGTVQNQLGTDLTVTSYWEMTLDQDIGHHFMLAFGANLLSLFGSK